MATGATDDEAMHEIKNDIINENLYPRISSETFTKEICEEQDVESTSSYTLASQSQFSNDVDRWIRGSSIQNTEVQNSRSHISQRSTLAATTSLGMSNLWYVLAMLLPIFSVNISCTQWRYDPSTVLNTAELLFSHVYAACQSIRDQIRRLARDQDPLIYVEVNPTTDEVEDVERRYTPELVKELQSAKDDTLLLYTEFSGRAGLELRHFMREMTGFGNRTAGTLGAAVLNNAPESCRLEMQKKLFKLESDTKLAASFSGVNHHKFLLGHMVVFRMHLNKSEDFIKKCDRVIASCGISCETTPRVRRWRRHAAEEIHRVRDDIQHTRRSYKDLVLHSHRHINHLRKQANTQAKEIIEKFIACSQ